MEAEGVGYGVDSVKRRRFGDVTSGLRTVGNVAQINGGGSVVDTEVFGGSDFVEDNQEGQPVTSRCSVKCVYDVISAFDQKRREMVEAIGFGGLLHFPPLKELNRRFTVWLMSKVDELSQTIVLEDGKRLPFSKEDVGLVFGIPFEGRRIKNGRKSRKEIKFRKETGEIFGEKKEERSIKRAQEIIEREYITGATKDEEESFKRSFVVFVMACLLAPGSRHDYACGDFWDALVDTGGIKEFDWASYVIQRLLDGVVKLKTDMMRRSKVSNIIGCALFLQVIYLDSVDLAVLNMEHTNLPRIRDFCDENISRMIAADYCNGMQVRGDYKFGSSNLRSRTEVCYVWARDELPYSNICCRSGSGDIWESLSEMANRLHVPTEAVGPVYFAIMENRREFEAKFDRAGKMLMCCISRILKCYMEGYISNVEGACSGSNPDDCTHVLGVDEAVDDAAWRADFMHGKRKLRESRCSGNFCSLNRRAKDMELLREIVFGRPGSSGETSGVDVLGGEEVARVMGNEELWDEIGCSADACEDGDLANMMACKAMARFYLISRRSKESKCVDLNTGHAPIDNEGELLPRKVVMCVEEARSPWEIRGGYGYDDGKSLMLIEELLKVDAKSSKSFWSGTCVVTRSMVRRSMFVHYIPKFVEVSCGAVRLQFSGRSEFQMDLFDVMLRRLKQMDDSLYGRNCRIRWRHYMESDFMGSIIAGWTRSSERCIRDQFVGCHLGYDVPSCKMIFFPLFLECRWVCYAWNMEENEIVIFDPVSRVCARSCSVGFHGQIVAMLQRAMHRVAAKYFVGWQFDWFGASIRMLPHEMSRLCRNRSGVLVAYFCLYFDGRHFAPAYDVNKLDEITSYLLSEALQLEDNFGVVPERLKN